MLDNITDIIVKQSIDPYLVYHIYLNHTKSEYDSLKDKSVDIVTLEFLKKYNDNCISIDIEYNESYCLLRKSFVNEFFSVLQMCGLNYSIYDATEEFWEMNDVDSIINYNNPIPKVEIFEDYFLKNLKLIIFQKYNLNDVLDKISKKGINSLNILNKYVLEKESR